MRQHWIGFAVSAAVALLFWGFAWITEGVQGESESWFWLRAVARVATFTAGAFLLFALVPE